MDRIPFLALAAAALLAPWGLPLPAAAGAPPAGPAAFSDPLALDNPFFPVVPGTVQLYAGREGRGGVSVIEQHLAETRTFDWQGGRVECRVMRDLKFAGGTCREISRRFFARADDGSVYLFGETPEPLPPAPADDGPDEPGDLESNGWVVGSLAPGDPPGTTPGASPTLFMPATPARGDSWKPEDLYPVVDETDRVVRSGVTLLLPAGRFRGCIEVQETSDIEPVVETKWYAPGVGVVKGRSRWETLSLRATTLRRR